MKTAIVVNGDVNFVECPLCRGTGMFEDDDGYPDACPECGGSGRVVEENSLPEPTPWFSR